MPGTKPAPRKPRPGSALPSRLPRAAAVPGSPCPRCLYTPAKTGTAGEGGVGAAATAGAGRPRSPTASCSATARLLCTAGTHAYGTARCGTAWHTGTMPGAFPRRRGNPGGNSSASSSPSGAALLRAGFGSASTADRAVFSLPALLCLCQAKAGNGP